MIYSNIADLIGKTPLVKVEENDFVAELLVKLEYFNPGGSVKDRIAKNMVEEGEAQGLLNKDTTIIEPTSGNTGIGLALVCAAKGYKLVLTMPETMSIERRKLLKAFGADLVLTPGAEGMKGAINRAKELSDQIDNSIILQQFINPANPDIHRKSTAKEILEDTQGKVDIFVAGVGTGGTITGVGEFLKQHDPDVKLIAVEPKDSPVLSGGNPGPHKIQGIGAGFIPDVLNTSIIDVIEKVNHDDAFIESRKLAKEHGILVGISSGAAYHVAKQYALKPENKGKRIVVILPDNGERYLSTPLYDEV